MKPTVSIVVVLWNSQKHLEKCLDSLRRQTYTDFEIIGVDNASSDDSVACFSRSDFRQVLIKNQENLGFAQAANQGIKASTAEFVLLLNPDVFPEPTFLQELVKTLSLPRHCGAAGGKLLLFNQEENSRLLDSTGLFLTRSLKARDRGNLQEDRGQYDQPENIFAVCGAAVLFRREALEKARIDGEYFDEDFFAYYDDLDLCWRLQLLGFECGYNPSAVAFHVRGGSGTNSKFFQKSPFMQRMTLRNRYFMLIKNLSFSNLLFFSPFFFLTELTLMFYSCACAPHLFSVYGDVAGNFKRMLKKRSFIQQSRTKNSRYIRSWIGTKS